MDSLNTYYGDTSDIYETLKVNNYIIQLFLHPTSNALTILTFHKQPDKQKQYK